MRAIGGPARRRLTLPLRETEPPRLWPITLLLGAGSLAFYAILIREHPPIYWGDGHGRVAERAHVLVGRWLPLLQFIVFAVGKLTGRLEPLRFVLATIAAFTVGSAVRLGSSLATRATGIAFGALLATNLLFVALAIVPYQEVLFAGLVFTGLALERRAPPGQAWLAAVALNLACLTRYEGWILVGALAGAELISGMAHGGPARGIRAAAACAARNGGTAIGWVVLLAVSRGGWRVSGSLMHARKGPWETVPEYVRQCGWQLNSRPLLAAAAVGMVVSFARAGERRRHAVVLGFVLASAVFILVDQPYSIGNLRQTFLPVTFALLYASIGFELLVRTSLSWLPLAARRTVPAAVLGVIVGVLSVKSAKGAARFVAASADEFRGDYVVGRWLELLPSGEKARAHVALIDPGDPDTTAIALYAGIPEARIVTASASLPAGTTHVVHIDRPGAAPSSDARRLIERLDDGTVPATATHLESAVVWALSAPPPST
jgi:hypothetical protein